MADEDHPQPANLSREPAEYEEKPMLRNGMSALATGAASGLFLSTIQNALQKHDHGAMGIFTRTGGTISLLAATAGMFGFTEAAVANFRAKDDALNGAAGGCAAGLVVGANARSIPLMVGSCAGMAALIGTFEAAGGTLGSSFRNQSTPVSHSAGHGGHGEHGEVDHQYNFDLSQINRRAMVEERRRSFFKNRAPPETKTE